MCAGSTSDSKVVEPRGCESTPCSQAGLDSGSDSAAYQLSLPDPVSLSIKWS